MEKQDLYEVYRLELETVSPILISSGSAESEYGTSFIKHNNRVYIIQWFALQKYLLEYKKVDIETIETICDKICNTYLSVDKGRKKDINIGHILRTIEINVLDDIEYIKKIASGVIILSDEKCIRKFICNAKGETYIPGTSVKGALRNGYMGSRMFKNKLRNSSTKPKLCKNIKSLAINADEINNLKEKLSQNKRNNSLDEKEVKKIENKLKQEKKKLEQEKKRLEQEHYNLKKNLPIEVGLVSQIKLNENEFCNSGWVKKLNSKYKNYFENIHSNMPNFDFFRGIKVFDSQKIEACLGNMRVLSIRNRRLKKKEIKIQNDRVEYYEGTFKIDITIDKRIINSFNIGFDFESFMKEVYFYYSQVWEEEREFHNKYCKDVECTNILDFYTGIKQEKLLRLGWGSGYLSTTLGTGFDKDLRKDIRNVFIRNHPSSIAPKSRKIIIDKDGSAKPFGWVRIIDCNKID